MPLTSAAGAGDFGDPYEEDQDAVTPEGEEEIQAPIAEPSDVEGEPETVDDVEPPDEELVQLRTQVQAQASHIGTLEGENRGYRDVLSRYSHPEEAEKEVIPASIFDNKDTKKLMAQAYEENPIEAMEIMGRAMEVQNRQATEDAIVPITQQSAEQQRLEAYTRMVNAEMAEAAQHIPGAKEIVQEYLASNGVSGRLVDRIKQKGLALSQMGANPQLAAAPGNFKSAIAEILLDTPAAKTASAPGAPRPRAKNVPERNQPEPDAENISEEDAYGDAIVNVHGPKEMMAEILKQR